MGVVLNVLLLAIAVVRVSCQSECDIDEQEPQWVNHDVNPTVVCRSNAGSTLKWFVVTDPCDHNTSATLVSSCTGNNPCQVPAHLLTVGCVVCCADSEESEFSTSSAVMCTPIRVCPNIIISAPSSTSTRTDVDVITYITTKPRLPLNSVSAYVMGRGFSVPIEAGEMVYPVPGGNSLNHAFLYTVRLSQATGDVENPLQVVVNVSEVPRGHLCSFQSQKVVEISLLKVNSSPNVCLLDTTTLQTPALSNSTLPNPSGLDRGNQEGGSHQLDLLSVFVGAACGVGLTTLAFICFFAVVLLLRRVRGCSYRCPSTKTGSHSFGASGGEQHLLTTNGTPATTPGSDTQRTLGQNSDTPASTPTELHNLLSGSQPRANPHAEIPLSTHAPIVVGSSTDHQPPSANPELSPPDHPPPVYASLNAPNAPRLTQLPVSIAQYHTHGEAVQLSQHFNGGSSRV